MLRTATELSRSDRDTQLNVMRKWFYAHYENPVENTPYDSGEGGYIYIWGGPYDPEEELAAEFGDLIPEELIKELAQELSDISFEWTGHSYNDDYLIDSISKTSKHHESFETTISNIEHLLNVEITTSEMCHLAKLLYINVITAIETYLADTFISSVANNKNLMRMLVETAPEFRNEKFPLSDIFKVVDCIESKVNSYLLDIVWHRLEKVMPIFKATLNIDFPRDMNALFNAVHVRHDLVHRNGKTRDGEERIISADCVKSVIEISREFVAYIDKQIRAP